MRRLLSRAFESIVEWIFAAGLFTLFVGFCFADSADKSLMITLITGGASAAVLSLMIMFAMIAYKK